MNDLVAGWRVERRSVRLVHLACFMALTAVRGEIAVMHVVPVGQRINRSQLVDKKEPSAARLQRWVAALPAPDPGGDPGPDAPVVVGGHPAIQRADVIIEWLDASSLLCNVSKSWKAAGKFAKIVSRVTTESHQQIVRSMQSVHKDTLRLSRTRLDIVCMLLQRKVFEAWCAGEQYQDMALYLFVDASPQWRGSELFALTIDTVDVPSSRIFRRLAPIVSLDRGLYDAIGKAMAVLWQFVLEVGPCWIPMKMALGRVRAIVSDLGGRASHL